MANRIKEIQFRFKLRGVIHQASIEELQIIKDELKKEFERRRKKNE